MRRLSPGLLLSVFALTACPDKAVDAPAPDAGVARAEPPDAGPPPLAAKARAELTDGGWEELPLEAGERPVIEPTQRLEVTTNIGLTNYRVRVFDEVDRAMESNDEAEEHPDRLVYRIGFLQPLKTGHRYTLAVDAQTGASVIDTRGRVHPDLRYEFQIAGEKEKPAPPPKKKRRR